MNKDANVLLKKLLAEARKQLLSNVFGIEDGQEKFWGVKADGSVDLSDDGWDYAKSSCSAMHDLLLIWYNDDEEEFNKFLTDADTYAYACDGDPRLSLTTEILRYVKEHRLTLSDYAKVIYDIE